MLTSRFSVGVTFAILSMLVSTAVVRGDELMDEDFAHDRIAMLIGRLDDQNVRVRADAVSSLREIGVEGRAAIPRLIDLLVDENWYQEIFVRYYVNSKASDALVAMRAESVGPLLKQFPLQSDKVQQRSLVAARWMRHSARAFLPDVQKKLQTATSPDREILLGTLASIDPTGQTALPILVRSLREGKNSAERRAAAEWLTRSGSLEIVYWHEYAPASDWFSKPSPESNAIADALILALKDPAADVRGPAAVTLSTYPEAAKRAVPALIPLLTDQDSYSVMVSNHLGGFRSVRGDAVLALSRMPDFADQSLAAFLQVLKTDAKFAATSGLAFAIADLAPHSKQPMHYLTEMLEINRPDVAIIALARLGRKSRAAIPRLQALARNGSQDWQRDDARTALAMIDPEGQPDAVTFVREKLEGEVDPGILDFLASVGREASFVFPWMHKQILERATGDPVDDHVLKVLAAIGPDAVSAAPQIIDCLDEDFLSENENTLVQFGPGVVPMLVDALKMPDKSPASRIRCLHVLGRLGPAASDSVGTIVLQFGSEYPRVREAAATTLGMIASRPNESLPALERLMSDPRPIVRTAAAKSCGRFGPDASRQVSQLIKRLSDDYLEVQVAAALALGQIGPAAIEAIPELTELSHHQNVLLRDFATDAVKRIQQR